MCAGDGGLQQGFVLKCYSHRRCRFGVEDVARIIRLYDVVPIQLSVKGS